MRQIDLAGLRVRLLGGSDGDGGGDGPLLVLMHGYGAPADDLVPLARELMLPKSVKFAFPEGILPLESGGDFYPMAKPRAWWPVDILELQNARAAGHTSVLSSGYPPGLVSARLAIIPFLDALEVELGVPSSRMLLGGFSQGAILACDVALHDARPLAGVVVLSGTLIGEALCKPLFAARQGTPVFQSHGRDDPLLPFDLARELHEQFVLAQWKTEFVEFEGGHSISLEVLSALRAFLLRVFPSLTP